MHPSPFLRVAEFELPGVKAPRLDPSCRQKVIRPFLALTWLTSELQLESYPVPQAYLMISESEPSGPVGTSTPRPERLGPGRKNPHSGSLPACHAGRPCALLPDLAGLGLDLRESLRLASRSGLPHPGPSDPKGKVCTSSRPPLRREGQALRTAPVQEVPLSGGALGPGYGGSLP